jgi:hypothetical protein
LALYDNRKSNNKDRWMNYPAASGGEFDPEEIQMLYIPPIAIKLRWMGHPGFGLVAARAEITAAQYYFRIMLNALTMLAVFCDWNWKEAFLPSTWSNWALAALATWAGCMALRTLRAIRSQAAAQMDADRAWVLVSVSGQPEEPLTGKFIEKGQIPGIV